MWLLSGEMRGFLDEARVLRHRQRDEAQKIMPGRFN